MKLVFVSKVPNENTKQNTGGMSRIITIDQYLNFIDDITYIDYKNKKIYIKKENRYIKFNVLSIKNVAKSADVIYTHAFANMIRVLPFLLFSKAKVIFDAHGLASVEERAKGSYFKSSIINFFESIALKVPDVLICVTNSMLNEFKKRVCKLPQTLVLPIVNKIEESNLDNETKNNIDLINKTPDEILICYSGGTQIWQNLDLMLDVANNSIDEKMKFLFLSKEDAIIKNKVKEGKLNKNIFVFSTNRNQIAHYYKLSDLGFLLREDNLINNVAFPTKLFEYLDFGVVPIVLNEKIGDFKTLGFKGVLLNELITTKKSSLKTIKKSNHNALNKVNEEFHKNKKLLVEYIKEIK